MTMYALIFYVPESHLETVKEGVFAAGAGHIGAYSHCAWQVKGQGQFKPLLGSQPYSGTVDRMQFEAEYRVELVCEERHIKSVIAALKLAHPYEVPAYYVLKLEDY